MRYLLLLITATLFVAGCKKKEEPIYRTCFTDEHCEELEKNDPVYKQHRIDVKEYFEKTGTEDKGCTEQLIIPLAFHFTDSILDPDKDRACIEELVRQQIKTLNEDFSAQNDDYQKWLDVKHLFPNTKSRPSCISFVVANKNHPNHILNYKLSDGQPLITIGEYPKGQTGHGYFKGYLNVWVYELKQSNLLGWASLPMRGNGDGTVLNSFAFGGTGSCKTISTASTLDKGRTLVHEISHNLNTMHTHQDGCNGKGDGLDDTPACEVSFLCPKNNFQTCESLDLHQNYMSYSNDECMFMFSAQQAYRMEEYTRKYLQHVLEKGKQVYEGENPEVPAVVEPPVVVVEDENNGINILAEIIKGDRIKHEYWIGKYPELKELIK